MQGIYLITNTKNGKRYVGMSNNINRRFVEHRLSIKLDKSTVLIRAFKKYSIEAFEFKIIETVENNCDLVAREIFWIKELQPEYNMNEGGNGNKGRRLSEKEKQVLREARKKQWESKTDQQKQAVIVNNLKRPLPGHVVSTETRQKLRLANVGKEQSASTRLKRSFSLQVAALGNTNGNKKVVCLKNDVSIKIYNSIKIASDFLGIHPSRISSVLKGRRISTAGFKWKYYTENSL